MSAARGDELQPIELFDPSRHRVQDFCSGSPSLDEWLKEHAHAASMAGTAATWVLPSSAHVVGYYSLAMGALARHGLPSRLGRGHPNPVPVLLLVRLAIQQELQGQGLGAELLGDALRRAVLGAWHYGARALIVDALDGSAYGFYRHHGFLPLTGLRLYRRVSDIARSMKP